MGEEGLVFSPRPFLLDPSIPSLENLSPREGAIQGQPRSPESQKSLTSPSASHPFLLPLWPYLFP